MKKGSGTPGLPSNTGGKLQSTDCDHPLSGNYRHFTACLLEDLVRAKSSRELDTKAGYLPSPDTAVGLLSNALRRGQRQFLLGSCLGSLTCCVLGPAKIISVKHSLY